KAMQQQERAARSIAFAGREHVHVKAVHAGYLHGANTAREARVSSECLDHPPNRIDTVCLTIGALSGAGRQNEDVPETKYARVADDSYVAYQVIGDGPIDLVYTAGWFGHVEAQWEYPALARFLERLASFSRLICFDRRGHGLSDPVDFDNITLEQWMDDVRVVMDDAGSERAALLGAGEGGPMTVLFAATHPARTSALVLASTSASMARRPDYPWGMPPSVQKKVTDGVQQSYWDRGAAAQF